MSVTQAAHGVEFEQAVVAMIDDDADADRSADRVDMAEEAFLLDLHQIGRQQQYSVGAGAFGAAREFGRRRAAITDARDDRRFSGRRLDRDRDDALEFVEAERKEFPGSSGGEQSGRTMIEQIRDMGAIFCRIQGAVGREMRDRKRQQTGADARLQVLGLDRHEVISRIDARRRV